MYLIMASATSMSPVRSAERHLRLDHPELGGVALGVGVLGTERRAEGIHVAEGHGEVLGVELAGDGQARLLAEEVLAVVHGAVLRLGDVVQVKRRHLEHLARALAVAARDDGGLDIDKAAALEELVDGVGRDGAHAERRRRTGSSAGADAGSCAGTPRCGAFSAGDSRGWTCPPLRWRWP